MGLLRVACPAAEAGTTVKLAELPAPARNTIQTRAGTAQVGEIFKTIESGEVTYEVRITGQTPARTFTVNDAGQLLAEQAFLQELPRPVQETIRAQVANGTLDDISKVAEDGAVSYEVQMTKAGKARDFTVDQGGKLIDMQVFLGELPAAVRSAIRRESRGGRCGEIHKSMEEGEAEYDVEITRDGKPRQVTFDPHGKIIYQEEPVALDETPAAVQQTLKGQLTEAKFIHIDKAVEEGNVTYEVELAKAGKHHSLSISPDGQILIPDAE
jgi:uncharacterized membrane protein YkoI